MSARRASGGDGSVGLEQPDLDEALPQELASGQPRLVQHHLATGVNEVRNRVAVLTAPVGRVHDAVARRNEAATGELLEHVANVDDDRSRRLVDGLPALALALADQELQAAGGRSREQGDQVDVLVGSRADVPLPRERGAHLHVVEQPEEALAVLDHVGQRALGQAEIGVDGHEQHDSQLVELVEELEAGGLEARDLARPDVRHEGLATAGGMPLGQMPAHMPEVFEVATTAALGLLLARRGVAGLPPVAGRLVALERLHRLGEELAHGFVCPVEQLGREPVMLDDDEAVLLESRPDVGHELGIATAVGGSHIENGDSSSDSGHRRVSCWRLKRPEPSLLTRTRTYPSSIQISCQYYIDNSTDSHHPIETRERRAVPLFPFSSAEVSDHEQGWISLGKRLFDLRTLHLVRLRDG